ncbi:hypothetical protein D3C74_01960 [compost metagenome]
MYADEVNDIASMVNPESDGRDSDFLLFLVSLQILLHYQPKSRRQPVSLRLAAEPPLCLLRSFWASLRA